MLFRSLWVHTLAGNPDAWQAHNRLGAVLVKAGDVEGAYEHFVASSTLRPDLGETHNNLGQTLALKGRAEEAVRVFEVAVEANKTEIRKAVEGVFKVKVENVRTSTTAGKLRRRAAATVQEQTPGEQNGPKGPEPTRYGDWERKGIISDF